jgi:hypothetical protein
VQIARRFDRPSQPLYNGVSIIRGLTLELDLTSLQEAVQADRVFEAASQFLKDSRYLLEQLELRNDQSGRTTTDNG